MNKLSTSLTALTLSAAALTFGTPALAKSTIGGVVFVNSYSSKEYDGTSENRSTTIDIANNSRVRVRWNNEDSVGMYLELGVGDDVKLRHAYGTWQINENWQILAGQTSTPFAPLNPSVAMVHNSGQSVGSVSPGRQSQVRFTYKFLSKRGAFAFAFVDPNNGETLKDANTGGEAEEADLGEKSTDFPRIDMGLAYKAFNWQIFPSAFFQRQTYDNVAADGIDDVDSWGASIGAKRGFGPVVVSFEYGRGQNWGNTKMSQSGSSAGDNAAGVTYLENGRNVLADNDNENYWIDVGYRFNAGEFKGTIHFIAGESNSTIDDLNQDYSSSMVGISAPIDLPWIARGFRIRPEIFVFDHGNSDTGAENDVEQGNETVVGVQLQYTF